MLEKDNSCSRIVLGTVALGTPYGIGESKIPDVFEVAKLFQFASDAGIYQLDTAPSYGVAESLVGAYASQLGFRIWTKLSNIPLDDNAYKNAQESINNSIIVLNQSNIDCLQWHNWSADMQENPYFLKIWRDVKENFQINNLGSSTYGVDNAMAAVKSGLFDLVQIEWNLLNQSVLDAVGDEAKKRGVKLALRSIFLQGVLTDKGEVLSGRLIKLRDFRQKAKQLATDLGMTLNALALRSALDHPTMPLVLIGPDRLVQLQEICHDAQLPSISSEISFKIRELTVPDTSLVDPRIWNSK